MRNDSASIDVEPVTLPAANGRIRGHLRTPRGNAQPVGVVVIHPATAVPQRLYSGFAEYLAAEAGFVVVTYDYRGTGTSGRPSEHRHIRMRDWMSVDVPAVAAWAKDRFPDLPHFAIGHSIGGHALALDYGTTHVSGIVMVASHAGVTAAIPPLWERTRVGVVLRILGPLFSRTLGYVPNRRIGLGEDMPAAAMLEWSRWSRTPGYFFDDPSMNATARATRVTPDVLALGFTDDPWATPRQIDLITGHLANAHVQRRTITPAEVGVSTIGHMGFFRRGLRDTLWPDITHWFTERAHSHP